VVAVAGIAAEEWASWEWWVAFAEDEKPYIAETLWHKYRYRRGNRRKDNIWICQAL
jgi:hypothetical protein